MDAFPLSLTAIFWLLIVGAGVVAVAKIYGLFFMTGKSPHRIGDAMANARAEVTEWRDGQGYVMAGGELWRARSEDALNAGDAVVVLSADGLELRVRKKNR